MNGINRGGGPEVASSRDPDSVGEIARLQVKYDGEYRFLSDEKIS